MDLDQPGSQPIEAITREKVGGSASEPDGKALVHSKGEPFVLYPTDHVANVSSG